MAAAASSGLHRDPAEQELRKVAIVGVRGVGGRARELRTRRLVIANRPLQIAEPDARFDADGWIVHQRGEHCRSLIARGRTRRSGRAAAHAVDVDHDAGQGSARIAIAVDGHGKPAGGGERLLEPQSRVVWKTLERAVHQAREDRRLGSRVGGPLQVAPVAHSAGERGRGEIPRVLSGVGRTTLDEARLRPVEHARALAAHLSRGGAPLAALDADVLGLERERRRDEHPLGANRRIGVDPRQRVQAPSAPAGSCRRCRPLSLRPAPPRQTARMRTCRGAAPSPAGQSRAVALVARASSEPGVPPT